MRTIILFVVALLLFIIVAPIGFLFNLLRFSKGYWKRINHYLLNVALTIDQSGNVVAADLFNWALIKEDKYIFGYPDETISSVLGKNKVINNLTYSGKILDSILDTIDPGHSVKSIDNSEGVKLSL